MHDKSIDEFFEKIKDHRHHNKCHKLIDVIIITICGVVAGADTYEQIENFGKKRKRWLSKFLELPYGIPSHDTFGRIFERMDPQEFQRCFKQWVASVAKLTKREVVAIVRSRPFPIFWQWLKVQETSTARLVMRNAIIYSVLIVMFRRLERLSENIGVLRIRFTGVWI